MTDHTPVRAALTIAGSDSGGGAGIQADLKTFAALGVYGTSAITAITAQNTTGVTGVVALEADFVTAQIEAVASDIELYAVKTGMLANAAIVEAVAAAILALELPRVVVDPVMVAKSGDTLLDEDAVGALRRELLPRALVVTPNVPEAEVLSGRRVGSVDEAIDAARAILDLGPGAVVMKGGHLAGPEVVDLLVTAHGVERFVSPRIASRNTHGTGCTFASAIAAGLAYDLPLVEAVRAAKAYVQGAIEHGLDVGRGHGPLGHFWRGLRGSGDRQVGP